MAHPPKKHNIKNVDLHSLKKVGRAFYFDLLEAALAFGWAGITLSQDFVDEWSRHVAHRCSTMPYHGPKR